MAVIDATIMLKALEEILIERRWLSPGEVEARAQQIINYRAAQGLPIPGDNTEG